MFTVLSFTNPTTVSQHLRTCARKMRSQKQRMREHVHRKPTCQIRAQKRCSHIRGNCEHRSQKTHLKNDKSANGSQICTFKNDKTANGSQFCTFEIAKTANESQPACVIGRHLFTETLTLRTRLRGAFQPTASNLRHVPLYKKGTEFSGFTSKMAFLMCCGTK